MSAVAAVSPAVDDLDALLARARQALAQGEHRTGLELAETARARSAGPALAEAWTLEGHHLWRLGRFEDAVVAAREAVAHWQSLDAPAGHAEALCLLTAAYTELGLHEEGLKCASMAFEIARSHGLSRACTLALNRIGVCHERLGDPPQGERFLLQALSRAREDRNFDDTLQALNNLMANTLASHDHCATQGDLEAAQQALQRARQYGSQALAMARREGGPYRQLVTQGNVGEVLARAGEDSQAEVVLTDTAQRAAGAGFRAVELRARHQLGELLAQRGEHARALKELHAVLEDLRRGQDHETTRLRVHRALYRSYKALGRFEPALAHCEAFHAIEMQRTALQAQAQARLMVNRLDMEQALRMADRALTSASARAMPQA